MGSSVTAGSVRTNGVGLESGVAVFVFNPTMVGVVVKVGEGTVGVKVGAAVGVFVKGGVGVGAGGLPRI